MPETAIRSRQPVELLTSPFVRFARMEAASGILLLIATVAALAWANSPWEASYHALWYSQLSTSFGSISLSESRHDWVNDGLMSVFFFVVGLEIKREILVGELSSLKQAAFPFVAALGGSLLPALIFFGLNRGTDGIRGWGIPMATDIAFALGVLALLGNRVPPALKIFVAALAIADDIFAVLAIAFFYTQHISVPALILGFAGVAASLLFNKLGIRNPIIYAIAGIFVWFAMLHSGVHATIAGILLAFTNIARRGLETATKITPGKRAPTITALEDPDWVAVNAMVTRETIASVMDDLTACGATDILVFNIANSRTG